MAVLDRTNDVVRESDAVDLRATLAWFRHGAGDPTTWLDVGGRGPGAVGRFVRATWTPDGPATLMIRWAPDTSLSAESWGPGGDWLLARVPAMIGDLDAGAPELEVDRHPVVAATASADRQVRLGASSTLYHELLPTIIEQRITSGEAKHQWSRLCHETSEAAPGPFARLLLPPDPELLRRRPSWWFHPLGIERKRAQPLIEVARHASKMWAWADLEPVDAARMLRLIPGIGVWTVGCVLGTGAGRSRRRTGRRLPRQEHRGVEPRERTTGHRRAYARPARTVRRPTGPGGPGDRASREECAQVRAEATHPADVALVTDVRREIPDQSLLPKPHTAPADPCR